MSVRRATNKNKIYVRLTTEFRAQGKKIYERSDTRLDPLRGGGVCDSRVLHHKVIEDSTKVRANNVDTEQPFCFTRTLTDALADV